MASVEVDLVTEKILKWEPLTDFDNQDHFQPNKLYNYNDLQTYLQTRMEQSSLCLVGNLVLNYAEIQTLVLTFTIKKFDNTNHNNCELLGYVYLKYGTLEWSVVLKSENHNYEDNGKVIRHSKVYSSNGNSFIS